MSEPTPIPWEVNDEFIYGRSGGHFVRIADTTVADGDEKFLSDIEADANAHHIIKCVNAHDELVSLARIMATQTDYDDEGNEGYWDEDGLFFPDIPECVQRARNILAKLEGGAK